METKRYTHVTRDIRCQIYALNTRGFSKRAIAKQLGFSPSTICREFKRNTGKRGYRYHQADEFAKKRRSAVCSKPKKMTASLKEKIKSFLVRKWSPVQIAGRLALEEGIKISHESIYRLIWNDRRQGHKLYIHLRHFGKKYNKRSGKTAGRGCIPNRIDIEERPAIVETKSRIGDFEGDTIIGANHKGAIVSYVDRSSKFTILTKVQNRTSERVTKATVRRFKALPIPVLTLTYDNGKEFSDHQTIAKALNATCYFAKPYHSWQRGLNEHTNGLVRQYLPKGTDFSTVTEEMVKNIEDALNHRPRKILNFRTPYEVFMNVIS